MATTAAPVFTVSNVAITVYCSAERECLACNWKLKLAIRPTLCGQFALFSATPRKDGTYRLLKLFCDLDHARNYLAKCH